MTDITTDDHLDEPVSGHATRRCWRCLQMFAEDAVYGAHPDQWWVCDACSAVLLPSKHQPRT